mmetsp:Transcript_14351/g.31406  ORF Transcript_14351/g.31406 Transcript_14351/m.31406 type:complete len:117 (+) Transcript_14351:116-466(+)
MHTHIHTFFLLFIYILFLTETLCHDLKKQSNNVAAGIILQKGESSSHSQNTSTAVPASITTSVTVCYSQPTQRIDIISNDTKLNFANCKRQKSLIQQHDHDKNGGWRKKKGNSKNL